MFRKLTLLTAAVALILGATAVSYAGAARQAHPVKDDRGQAFPEFERLLPLVKKAADDDKAAAQIREGLKNKSPWLAMAAVEAVRQAEIDEPGSGKAFLPEVLALMGDDFKKLHEEQIFTVNVIACLGVLARGDEQNSLKVVDALVKWQLWSNNQVVRLRDMAERVLSGLTGEDCTLTDETVSFWQWWVRNKGTRQADKPPEKRSRTAPIVFKEPIVGTRIVFVIDVSDSMKWPIDPEDLPKIKQAANNLDWKKMPRKPCPLDVAKAELAYSIDKLRPTGKPKKRHGGRKHTTSSKDDLEARSFAIITYSRDAKMLTDGWVEATNKNCNHWMREADKLKLEYTTNIEGALRMAFGLSDSPGKPSDPALDRECVLTGAHTIVFLTDGYPSWSNDSDSISAQDEFKNPVGDGKYVKRENLLELAAHLDRFRKVVINTVGIGLHDKKLMRGLAEISGGKYTDWGCNIIWKKK